MIILDNSVCFHNADIGKLMDRLNFDMDFLDKLTFQLATIRLKDTFMLRSK